MRAGPSCDSTYHAEQPLSWHAYQRNVPASVYRLRLLRFARGWSAGSAHRSGRRGGPRSSADAVFSRRSALCHRRVPDFGHRDIFRLRGSLRARGLLEAFRIGMFLEVATTVGAVFGAFIAAYVPVRGLAIIFGTVLIYSAWLSWRQSRLPDEPATAINPWSDRLRLSGSYPDGAGGEHQYTVDRISAGFGTMFGAGTLSGLLGIGSGAVKVLAMDRIMRIPFKVSTTTSNFMIGVTAAASAGIYLHRGYIDPGLAFPVMLGVLGGSLHGGARADPCARLHASHYLHHRHPRARRGDDRQRLAQQAMTQISKPGHAPSRALDHRIESMMGRLLQVGVLLASTVVLIGGLLYLRAHAGITKDYSTFKGEPASLRHPVGTVSPADDGRPSGRRSARRSSADCDTHRPGRLRRHRLRGGARPPLCSNQPGRPRRSHLPGCCTSPERFAKRN